MSSGTLHEGDESNFDRGTARVEVENTPSIAGILPTGETGRRRRCL
jgi:hypothetical protein